MNNPLAELAQFNAVDGNFAPLRTLIEALPDEPVDDEAPILLGVLERHPADDGDGMFWTLLHRLEDWPGYIVSVQDSVRRTPTEFNLNLVQRRLSNRAIAGDERAQLLTLLADVEGDAQRSLDARGWARSFLALHTAR